MSTERDTTRLVRSWMEEGVTAVPDRVLDAVLDLVPAIPQRRPWWPARRSQLVSNYMKLVAAAAALAAVAFVGYQLMPGSGPGSQPTPVPTPTPTLAAASPTPTALAWPRNDAMPLAPGTYVAGDPYPVRLSVTVPAGWHGWVAGPYYADLWLPGTDGGFYFVLPGTVSVDPCDLAKGFGPVGPTVDDLVAALRKEPGLSVSGDAPTSIDGYRGTQLVVKAPKSLGSCTLSSEGVVLWQNPLGGISPGLKAGESIRLWILDVEGNRLIVVRQDSSYSAAQRAQADAVFDSIHLDPAS